MYATNTTPHEQLFNYARRSSEGTAIPSWFCEPGLVLLKHHVRASKTDPLVDDVELLQANLQYAHNRYPDGKEDTVSARHFAPAASETGINPENKTNGIPHSTESTDMTPQ